jgi:putative peptidoglycan lipid II flippase
MPRASGILRASIVSATGTGLSRVLGAARDVALSHVFGAGRASDAFWLAWTVPGVFRRFVADEGLTGALIPAVAQAERDGGPVQAQRLANRALMALLITGAVICVGGILGAPWLVKVFAYGFADDAAKLALTVTLTRWLFPFVVFVSLVSYCEALLNHRGHFFVPKLAPGVVSGSIAAAAVLLSDRFKEPVISLVVGVWVGGLAHLLVCLPPLVRRWGLPVPALRGLGDARFRRFLGEMGKVALIGTAAQLNVVLLRLLASLLPEGAVTQYWYANRVVDLAQGAVAVGVGSALLPVIARDAAERRFDAFREHFQEAVRLAALVLLPAAGLLLALAGPIVALLFRHGRFDVAAAATTAATLRMLVPFMLALAGINIVKRAFYALDDRTSLLAVGICGVVATGALGLPLSRSLGVAGLGLALSLSAAAQLLVYILILRRRMAGGLGVAGLSAALARIAVAAVPAALVALWVCRAGRWEAGPADPLNWALFLAAVLASAVTYGAVGAAAGVAEIRRLLSRLTA